MCVPSDDGGNTCSCQAGFELNPDKKTCKKSKYTFPLLFLKEKEDGVLISLSCLTRQGTRENGYKLLNIRENR